MPYAFTNPKITTATYSTARIEAFSLIRLNDSPAGPACEVLVSYGNEVGGVYTIEESEQVVITGSTLLAAMGAAPVGASVYDVVKNALYAALDATGTLDPGTVT